MRIALGLIAVGLAAGPAAADELPAYFKLPAGAHANADDVVVEDYGWLASPGPRGGRWLRDGWCYPRPQ